MTLAYPRQVERWGLFEISLTGPDDGDPFHDTELRVVFKRGSEAVAVDGFYDGDGRYLVRFSPNERGEWSFRVASNRPELVGHEGRFDCIDPGPGNHGPVDVDGRFHFAYRDGTRYVPVGTTCYAWIHQPLDVQERTLQSLRASPFNKLRMCVFPKDYIYNENEPPLHRYAVDDDHRINPRRPSVAYFQHLDRRIAELGELGIEADIILFHPYDRWGYMEMSEEDDLAYLRYVVARLGAYRNVWWSLANEYDFLLDLKPLGRWEKFFHVVHERDPHRRLTSIHNGHKLYDHARPEISHVSIQSQRTEDTNTWRDEWGKPVVNDEPQYEGDIPDPWGNISARELVHRFWMTATRGGYAGHGETYLVDDHELWWAKGGTLRGESPTRIGFLRRIMEESAGPWEPLTGRWEWGVVGACDAGSGERIVYFGTHQPKAWFRGFPDGRRDISVELIDPWAMSIEPLDLADPPYYRYPRNVHDQVVPVVSVELPGRPYLALRVRWP